MALKILMVCLGNICRSPIAHGLLHYKSKKHNLDWQIDSAGTSDLHEGELPNSKSILVMQQQGIDITYQRSRPLVKQDLQQFDLIFVMDSSNYQNVKNMAEGNAEIAKIKLIMNEVTPGMNQAVPDPWGLSQQHYKEVFTMLNEATDKVIQHYQ